jgi:Uma2 family endonuclease
MLDSNRMSVDDFFAWHEHVEGRYELVDGHIVPHPDYVSPAGLSAPANEHAAIIANLAFELRTLLPAPCRVFVGAGAQVDRINANIPDLAVSCDPADRTGKVLKNPRFIFEVLSPKTKRIDLGRKVPEYLAIASLETYAVIDGERRTVTLYRPDGGAQTFDDGERFPLADDLSLAVDRLFQ